MEAQWAQNKPEIEDMAKAKKVTAFNQDNVAEVRKEVEAALAKVGEKFGLTLGIGRITFMKDSFSTKLTAVMKTDEVAAATSNDQEAARSVDPKWINDFNRYAPLYNMKKEHLGKTIKFGGNDVVVVGWRNRANYKVVARNVADGKLMCISHTAVAKILNA